MQFWARGEVHLPLSTATIFLNFPIIYHFKKIQAEKKKPVIMFQTEQDKFLIEKLNVFLQNVTKLIACLYEHCSLTLCKMNALFKFTNCLRTVGRTEMLYFHPLRMPIVELNCNVTTTFNVSRILFTSYFNYDGILLHSIGTIANQHIARF